MKFSRLIIIISLMFLTASCVDNGATGPIEEVTPGKSEFIFNGPKYPGPYKIVLKDGTEYLRSRGEVGKQGGTYHAASIGQGPRTFNIWASKDSTSSTMGGLMFESLLTTDPYTGESVPFLAKSYSVSSDNLQYTVTLRRGMKWSDGKPITADDVVFTWEQIIKPGFGNASSRENLLVDGQFPEIKKLNDYTVKFTTAKPFAPFLREMGGVPIAPKHILEPVTKKGDNYFSSFWGVDANPKSFVTNGKFILSRYSTGQRVEFRRNPEYHMIDKAGNVLPYLDKYVFYIVGDQNNELFKFKAGEIDEIAIPGKNVAKLKEEEMKSGSNFKIYNLGPATSTAFIVLNMNNRINPDTKRPFVDPIKQKWFQNMYFRKAVDWSIDRENIVSNVVQGVGEPLFTAESLTSIYLNKKLAKGHPRDVKKAREYLVKGGFKYKNGKLYDQDGHRVEFSLLTNAGNNERESIGVIVKEDLEQLGMKVNFKALDFNALVAKLTSFLDWDTVIIGLTGSPLEPHSGRNVWNSDGTLHMFNLRKGKDKETKAKLYDFEKELDDLFEQGARTLDPEQRKVIYGKYQEVVYENLPMIYLYSPLNIVALRKRFGNIQPTILGGITHNLEEIYIKD